MKKPDQLTKDIAAMVVALSLAWALILIASEWISNLIVNL